MLAGPLQHSVGGDFGCMAPEGYIPTLQGLQEEPLLDVAGTYHLRDLDKMLLCSILCGGDSFS